MPWTGAQVSMEPTQLHLRKLEFSADDTAQLILACRLKRTTLTGLPHALILVSLSKRLKAEEAAAFVATTPVSLTGLADPPAGIDLHESLSVLVTGFYHEYLAELVQDIRQFPQDADSGVNDVTWDIARRTSMELKQKVKTLPKDDIMGYVKLGA